MASTITKCQEVEDRDTVYRSGVRPSLIKILAEQQARR